MRRLYFMRHGLTELNIAGLFAGRTETPLTEQGRHQAQLAGEAARSLGIDCIVASSMGRAIETAEIVAKSIGYPPEKIYTSDFLIERTFGVLEAQPYYPDIDMDTIEGAEKSQDLFTRAQQAYEWLQTLPGDNILVIGHGSTGRALRHIVNPEIPFRGAGHFANAEIVQFI